MPLPTKYQMAKGGEEYVTSLIPLNADLELILHIDKKNVRSIRLLVAARHPYGDYYIADTTLLEKLNTDLLITPEAYAEGSELLKKIERFQEYILSAFKESSLNQIHHQGALPLTRAVPHVAKNGFIYSIYPGPNPSFGFHTASAKLVNRRNRESNGPFRPMPASLENDLSLRHLFGISRLGDDLNPGS